MMDYMKLLVVAFIFASGEALPDGQHKAFFPPIQSLTPSHPTPIPVSHQAFDPSSSSVFTDDQHSSHAAFGNKILAISPQLDITRTIAEKYGLQDISESNLKDQLSAGAPDFESLLDVGGSSVYKERPSPHLEERYSSATPTPKLDSEFLHKGHDYARASFGADLHSRYSPDSNQNLIEQELPVRKHGHYHDSPKYSYGYKVTDDYGNDYGHEETRDGYDVRGSYKVLLPDGRTQTVTYYVSGDSGFVAEVTYDGKPHYQESPIHLAPKHRPIHHVASEHRKKHHQKVRHPTDRPVHQSLPNQGLDLDQHQSIKGYLSGGLGGHLGHSTPAKKYRPVRPNFYEPPFHSIPKPTPLYKPTPVHDSSNFPRPSHLITPSPFYARPSLSRPAPPTYKAAPSYIPPKYEHSSYA